MDKPNFIAKIQFSFVYVPKKIHSENPILSCIAFFIYKKNKIRLSFQVMNTSRFVIAVLLSVTLAVLSFLLEYFQILSQPMWLPIALRWVALGAVGIGVYNRKSLTAWIFYAMLVGIELGVDWPSLAEQCNIFSKLFLRLIKTIIAPLLFGTLVVGIAGHSDVRQVGRMGWKSLLYFEIITTLALIIGLLAINLTQAGNDPNIRKENKVSAPVNMQWNEATLKIDSVKNTFQILYKDKVLEAPRPPIKQKWDEVILHIFPENVAKMVYDGQVLQIVVFSILFGIGLLFVARKKAKQAMLHFAEGLTETMFKVTAIIMYLTPLAVGGAMAHAVADMGIGVLRPLLLLVATLYGALVVFVFLVLLPVCLLFRINFIKFMRAVSEPMSIAFATATSEAALPRAMEVMQQFGVPRKIIAFVIPMGYSFNLDGTTLYLALASVFVAQAAGIDLSLSEQLLMVLTLMLTSKGVAGVPRASLVILMGMAASFNLPEWPIFLIVGVDELMDMARTSVNVMGNCLASAVVARWEGELNDNGPALDDSDDSSNAAEEEDAHEK